LSLGARSGNANLKPRTQSSLAVSSKGTDWVVFNASPDIRQQIDATPELQPNCSGPLRSTPIRAVVLTNADVDHIAGLLSLREREPLAIYASARVLQVLADNPIFNVLDPAVVVRRELALEEPTKIADAFGRPTGLVVEAFVVPGKVALFLEDPNKAAQGFGTEEGDTIGLAISSPETDKTAYYIPGCAGVEPGLKRRLTGAECLLFDGTVYTDEEMITAGVGTKTGARMGHMHIAGTSGSIEAFSALGIRRRIFVHINNTNPILDDTSAERAAVEGAGWVVAHDGMEVVL